MTADKEARTFGVTEIAARHAEEDWRELSRAEMFERVIVALDGAKSEAEEVGDENYVRYVGAVLFPFLEAELEKARREQETLGRCSVGASTQRPCRRSAVYRDGDDGPRFCERHLMVVRLQEVVSEVETFLYQRMHEVGEWADLAEDEGRSKEQ